MTGQAKCVALLLLVVALCHVVEGGMLSYGFYSKTCPKLEDIVKKQVAVLYYKHGNTVVSWLRNIFHNCAVGGCDASLLLDYKTGGLSSEKASFKNFGLRNFKYIEVIKAAVEKECPNIVSCADIVILSGRDGIAMLGGPYIPVKTGRRDTRYSSKEMADKHLFETDVDVTSVLTRFKEFGLNTPQSVSLLGSAHTVGRTHCINLVQRLYPRIDLRLNPSFALYLKKRCPSPKPNPKAVDYSRNDLTTPVKFDNQYFKNIIAKKGLLGIDDSLYTDPRTSPYVRKFAEDNGYFFRQFNEAISFLSQYKVLTGQEGEIRRVCRYVNPK